MDGVPANRRPVNLVFQSYALFPHLRVRDNIAFGLEMKGLARSEIRERVRDILAMVKLSSREDRWPRELSGGEQQRVALARALINRPAVLLLDEPLSALDQQLRQEMQMELKAIQELVGITFVCVTHHQQEALAMSSRVGVMQEGRLVQVGSPREVYDRPASLSIARFIGESNELQGELRPGDSEDGMMIMTPSQANLSGIKVSGPGRPNWPRKVILSLRPEHLHLSREGIRSGYDNLALGRIEKCLYGGHQTQYVAQLADAVTWKVVMPTARGEEKTFAPGERVWLGWRADEGLIFPE
jgi:spermidine/putrescine transport system ATP-binding protein